MRRYPSYGFIVLCTALIPCLLRAQAAGGPVEAYGLLCDRDHYITGEAVRFSALPVRTELPAEEPVSRVLYVELITPKGRSLVRKKVPPDDGRGFHGRLTLPKGLATGTYYLKAYTRWMRNCGPASFSYKALRVYNPFSQKVLPVDTAGPFTVDPAGEGLSGQGLQPGAVICRTGRPVYGRRQPVELNLRLGRDHPPARVAVSVAKEGVLGGIRGNASVCKPALVPEGRFIPEVRGVSLTGSVVEKAGGEPVPYGIVYVTVTGRGGTFYCNYTDSTGRFYFALPDYRGSRELFVSASHPDDREVELLIDLDFSNDTVRLPSYPVILGDSLRERVKTLSVNAQIASQYHGDSATGQKRTESRDGSRLFYGDPSAIIHFDEFIRLPAMAEYFNEVVPQVAIRKRGGERTFVVQGDNPELKMHRPLVLIDGVAIFDVEAVLAVSPGLIDRVEIIDSPYIRGNVTFGGIISIRTRNNDLAYIDLPASGLLVDYQMLDPEIPDRPGKAPENDRLPDVRNTLYWHPGILLMPGEETVFGFHTADEPGAFRIAVSGFDREGDPVSSSCAFQVVE